MLQTNDCVTIKDVKDPVNYSRVWFEFGPNDETEELTKKSGEGKLMVNGEVWKGTTPKAEVSGTEYAELVQQAIDYFKSMVKRDKDETDEDYQARQEGVAWTELLENASRGYDSLTRNTLQAKNRPTPLVTEEAGLEKLVKTFISMGMSADIARVTAKQAIENGKAQKQAA